jgi:hypothetical protein
MKLLEEETSKENHELTDEINMMRNYMDVRNKIITLL